MSTPTPEEERLVAVLRGGDEEAFQTLVDRYHPYLLRLAGCYVRRAGVAEEVCQETWLGMLRGIHRFEARSSFRTWLSSILINLARTRAKREARSVPFAELAPEDSMDPALFQGPGGVQPDHWVGIGPGAWPQDPERELLAREMNVQVRAAIDSLPEAQATVITMRDLEGLNSKEICNVLEISETNQRVLLHRARTKVRKWLDRHGMR